MPKRNPEKAVQMLDMLLEFFGEDGQRWIRGAWNDPHGNRCLVGVMTHLRKVMNLKSSTAGTYLRRVLPVPVGLFRTMRHSRIQEFNDECPSFKEVKAVILEARDLAQAEFDELRRSTACYKITSSRSGRDSALVQIEGEELR